MKNRITRAEAKAFRDRWSMVSAEELRELRLTPFCRKFHQLAALMISAEQLGWNKKLAAEEAEVRGRWNRLRRAVQAEIKDDLEMIPAKWRKKEIKRR